MRYKRNQVEEAISRAAGSLEPVDGVGTKLKRLLDTDRKLGCSPRSVDPERANFAFYRTGGPGRGSEVWFSDYEAFALFTSLRLLQHGWPQIPAVNIVRHARKRLEQKHAEILRLNSPETLDEVKMREAAVEGALGLTTNYSVFLAISSLQERPIQRETDPTREIAIIEKDELSDFMRRPGLSASFFELATPAHRLRQALLGTVPSKRGRPS